MDRKACRDPSAVALAEGDASVSEEKSIAGDENKEMIQVVVEIAAKAGQRDAVLKAFKAHVPAVHAEQGCIEYSAFVDAQGFGARAPFGDDTSVPIHHWHSPSHLKPHSAAPHILKYHATLKDL